ncbi:MAG: D-alanine--D-alanine ligase [Planctomycetaceae bacterium]|nr:D-alanine--D-alanine ligase [Planctomycetaceae bacterium]
MRPISIGFTYDAKDDYLARGYDPLAVAEFDSPVTIDAIDRELTALGHTVDRIGSFPHLVERLAGGDRWDLVFNIAEGLSGPGREAQVPAVLEAYGIPVTFGDSLCLAVCLHKGHTKHIVHGQGVRTAPFAVVDTDDFDFDALPLRYPLFAKPVAEGTGKGVLPSGKAANADQLRQACRDLLGRFRQPVLVEEFLPGREFTVGIVGTGAEARVLGVMEVELLDTADPDVYSYENKDRYLERVRYHLATGTVADEAADLSLRAYRVLGCRDAGRADIRLNDEGKPNFIEINPLAGLNPDHSDLPILCRLVGIGYEELIRTIVEAAVTRGRHY